MADRRGYNGLHIPGGVPNLAQPQMSREQQAQRAIAMEMQAICRELFIRTAARWMVDFEDEFPSREDYESLSRNSQLAARSYFTGLGVITDEPDAPADSTAAE